MDTKPDHEMRKRSLRQWAWIALCATALHAAVPPDQPPLSPGVMRRLERATWIRDVHTKPSARAVYVFADPECSYCNQLWTHIRASKGQGAEVRYILVGVITPQSPTKAAAILESSDPSQALAEHEAHFAKGGIKPAAKLSDASNETLSIHSSLMEALGIPATPAVVYQDGKGETHVFFGLPSAQELKEILAPSTSS
jgi:thiol:disulfide interchange protein DsbG